MQHLAATFASHAGPFPERAFCRVGCVGNIGFGTGDHLAEQGSVDG